MAHIKLKQLLENNSAALANKQIEEELYKELSEAFEHDLKRLEETLISEGFGDIWNKIKQKGSEMAQGAKNALLKPLLKLIIDKIAKSDPQGMAKLVNAAKNNPKAIGGLMNSPQVQAKQKEVSQELKSINEVLTEDEHEELFQEYVDTILKEARVLSNDPRNVKRRELAAQRKKAKAAPAPDATPTPAPEKTPAPKKGKASPKKPKTDPKQAGPDKNKDQEQGKQQSLIQKVYGFAKKYPKISAVVGVALLGVVAAAVVGSGGVIPLITSTLASSATGALSGALGGGVISGVKDAGSQYFKSGKVNWKQAGQAALQGAKTGAKYGAISGATGNIAGKAIAGVGKMATWAGNALSAGKGAKDATGNAPETKRNPSMDSQEGGPSRAASYEAQMSRGKITPSQESLQQAKNIADTITTNGRKNLFKSTFDTKYGKMDANAIFSRGHSVADDMDIEDFLPGGKFSQLPNAQQTLNKTLAKGIEHINKYGLEKVISTRVSPVQGVP